jgi:hypothetical protein
MFGPWTRPLVMLQRSSLCLVTALAFTPLLAVPTRAVELEPETVAAFNQYIRATEARITRDLEDGRFLVVDDLSDEDREEAYAQLRQGRIYIERLRAEEQGKPIKIPHGLIHHWVGIVFIPGATLAEALV